MQCAAVCIRTVTTYVKVHCPSRCPDVVHISVNQACNRVATTTAIITATKSKIPLVTAATLQRETHGSMTCTQPFFGNLIEVVDGVLCMGDMGNVSCERTCSRVVVQNASPRLCFPTFGAVPTSVVECHFFLGHFQETVWRN